MTVSRAGTVARRATPRDVSSGRNLTFYASERSKLTEVEFIGASARFVLSTTFILAAAAKIGRRTEFEVVVDRFGLLPKRWSGRVARWLPRFELAAGLFLAVGILVVPVTLMLVLALLTFTAALSINLKGGRDLDCGCFGRFRRAVTWTSVWRNVALLATGGAILLSHSTVFVGTGDSPLQPDARSAPVAALAIGTLIPLVGMLIGEARGLWATAASLSTEEER